MQQQAATSDEYRWNKRLAQVSTAIVLPLMVLFGYWTATEMAIERARASDVLTTEAAVVTDIRYDSGYGYGAGMWTSQDIELRFPGSNTAESVELGTNAPFLDVEKGESVSVGRWGDEVITINGAVVYRAWNSGVVMLFLAVPPLFLVAISRLARLHSNRRKGKANFFSRSMYYPFVASAVITFIGSMILLLAGVIWWPIGAFVLAVGLPLAWTAATNRKQSATGQ